MLCFSTIVIPDLKPLFTRNCILIFFLIFRNETPSLVTTIGGPTLSPTSLMIAWVQYLPLTMSVCHVDWNSKCRLIKILWHLFLFWVSSGPFPTVGLGQAMHKQGVSSWCRCWLSPPFLDSSYPAIAVAQQIDLVLRLYVWDVKLYQAEGKRGHWRFFLKQESLPGHLHYLQHRRQVGVLAGNAVCNGTLLSSLLWGQGQVRACLHPFASTRQWLCMAEASSETGSSSPYCIVHGDIVPLLHNVGKKKSPTPSLDSDLNLWRGWNPASHLEEVTQT